MNDADILELEARRVGLLDAACEASKRYLNGLDERPAGASHQAVDALRAALESEWSDNPKSDDEVLRLLSDVAGEATVGSAGRRYFGFVTGGALPVTLAANWLAGAWDQNAFSMASSPAAVLIEQQAAKLSLAALDLPSDWAATFVTGATMANFCGLVAARHALMTRAGWDVERDGLFDAPPLRVIVGAEAHPSMLKALGFTGLGRARVETVPVDAQGAMRADLLPGLDERCIVCAQAGNVNSGAFDPLVPIGEAVAAAGAWLHVDGAFGIWARASESLRSLARGAELAHSIATDGHKWLNVPYDCGIAFVRDPAALQGAMSIGAPYLPMEQVREPLQLTPESSRRARGVEVWAALASLGRKGLADLIERNCAMATQMEEALRAGGVRVLNEVNLNQVVVGFDEPERAKRVVSAIQAEGTCWVGPTQWREQPALRISVSSWATTSEDIRRSADAIIRAVDTAN